MRHKRDSSLASLDAAAHLPVKLNLATHKFLCELSRLPQARSLCLGLGFLLPLPNGFNIRILSSRPEARVVCGP